MAAPNDEALGKRMTVETPPERYKLAGLMAEMPQGLPRVEGWEDMPAVGREVSSLGSAIDPAQPAADNPSGPATR